MSITKFSNTRMVRGLVAVVAALAFIMFMVLAFSPSASSAQVIDAEFICEGAGGSWDGENQTCDGLAPAIICTVYGQLSEVGIPLPSECNDVEEEPTDYCDTVEGTQNEEDPCPSQEELDCVEAGGTWNSETDTCTPADNGGGDNGGDNGGGSDNSSNTSSGGGSIGGGGRAGGQVLGASTEMCGTPLLKTYLRIGKKNDSGEVALLQIFLNKELGLTMEVTGVFSIETEAAVNQFQVKYADEVLSPWVPFGLLSSSTPTGYVYKTTQRMINKIHCASLEIPMPQLP